METNKSEGAEWERQFDATFALDSDGCSECAGTVLIDKREVPYPKGTYHCEWDLGKIKAFIAHQRQQAVAEFAREVVALSDRIELEGPDGGTKQWMAFKRFRNTVRDIAIKRGIEL